MNDRKAALDELEIATVTHWAEGGRPEAEYLIKDHLSDKTLEAIKSALMDDWQDIASAPMNETDVLLYVPDNDGYIITGYWSNKKWNDNARGSWWGFKPTHWRPIPAPPSAGVAKALGE